MIERDNIFSGYMTSVSSCRGGKYSEDEAKSVMIQILNVVAFCHLQGVVHRDLKPEVKYILKTCKVHILHYKIEF